MLIIALSGPANAPHSGDLLEPTTGIEPVNLFLTKEVLYLLSYVGPCVNVGWYARGGTHT